MSADTLREAIISEFGKVTNQGRAYQSPTEWSIATQEGYSDPKAFAECIANAVNSANVSISNFWQDPVIGTHDPTIGLPQTPLTGDRYLSSGASFGWLNNFIYEWDGASWIATSPVEGMSTWVSDVDAQYFYNGSSWVQSSGSSDITNGQISNWDTAYSWGDHSTSGYVKADGSVPFIAPIQGVAPVNELHLTTKKYVDELVSGSVGHDPVSVSNSASIGFTLTGQNITASIIASGVDHDSLLNYNSNQHIDHSGVSVIAGTGLTGGGTIDGDVTLNLGDTAVTPGTYGNELNVPQIVVDQQGRITSVSNVAIGGFAPAAHALTHYTGNSDPIDHAQVSNLNSANYHHLTQTNHTDLTDGGNSALHYHSIDRLRSNHLGTQTASTISDFDTEVSNNTDVSANTSARHAAATILDSSSINFSISGQQISGAVIPGGVDHDSLSGFVGNEHIDHSGISVIAGTGLTGGGTIDGDVTINCSITQYTDEMAQDAIGSMAGTGLTYTDATPDLSVTLSPFDTGDLSEGSNLYYTNTRADDRIAAATLDDLNDVVAYASLADGEILVYNTAAGGWRHRTLAEAGVAASSHDHDADYEPLGVVSTHESTYDHSLLHSPVTIVDSSSIDFTLTGQQITGVVLPAGVSHSALANLNTSSYYHLTQTNHTDLTDGGNSALHYHSIDRLRSNHTGTQAWSTITSTPTTLSGYGITDAAPLTHGVTAGYIPGASSTTTWENSPMRYSGGFVGIGGTPSAALDIATPASGGALEVNVRDNTADSVLITQDSNEYLNIDTTNASEKITIGNSTVRPSVIVDGGYLRLDNRTEATAEGAEFRIRKYRGSSSGVAADVIGDIEFYSLNDAVTPEDTQFAKMQVGIQSPTDGSEQGFIRFYTMDSGSSVLGLRIIGTTVTLAGEILASSIGTGTGNNVVVQDGSGYLRTDEIDSRVWGSTLLDQTQTDTLYAPLTHGVTAGYIPGAASTTTWENSPMRYSGGNVAIGLAGVSPSAIFHVAKSGTHNSIRFDTYSSTQTDRTILDLTKSASNTVGTALATEDGESLGLIRFRGCDSGNGFAVGVSIEAFQNGDPGAVYIPADLKFRTYSYTAENTNQLVLHHGGGVGIGFTEPAAVLSVNGGVHVGGDTDPGDNNLLVDGLINCPSIGTGTGNNVVVQDGSGYLRTRTIDTRVWGSTLLDATQADLLYESIGAVSGHESTYDHSLLHSPVTISDSSSIDFTLTGQQITGSVIAAGVNHSSLGSLNTTSYYHLTQANHTDLTDGGNSALHYHSTDRNRSNHTGTQAWSTITSTPTTRSGYGITDAAPLTHGVSAGYIPVAASTTTWENSTMSVDQYGDIAIPENINFNIGDLNMYYYTSTDRFAISNNGSGSISMEAVSIISDFHTPIRFSDGTTEMGSIYLEAATGPTYNMVIESLSTGKNVEIRTDSGYLHCYDGTGIAITNSTTGNTAGSDGCTIGLSTSDLLVDNGTDDVQVSGGYLHCYDGTSIAITNATTGNTAGSDGWKFALSSDTLVLSGYEQHAKFEIHCDGSLAAPVRAVYIDSDGIFVDNDATVHIHAGNSSPTSGTNGALWLDTDAGTNGTLKIYSNSSWRTVVGAHNHAWSEITSGVPSYATRWPSWSEVTSKPSTFTPSAHNQAWSTITSRPTTVAGYGITDAVPFSNSGHIGIGISQQIGTSLYVNEDNAAVIPLRLNQTNTGGYSALQFMIDGSYRAHVGFGHSSCGMTILRNTGFFGTITNNDQIITTNDQLRVMIKNSGEVGIATDSPDSGVELDVNGQIQTRSCFVTRYADRQDVNVTGNMNLTPTGGDIYLTSNGAHTVTLREGTLPVGSKIDITMPYPANYVVTLYDWTTGWAVDIEQDELVTIKKILTNGSQAWAFSKTGYF